MSNTKTWKICLLVTLLLFLCPSVFAQTGKVTVKVTDAPLSQVISLIEQQTNYRFSYRDVVLDSQKNVSVDLKDASVQDVLNAVFSGRDLSYNILSDRSIVVYAAQTRQDRNIFVKGTVKDTKGDPVIGAGVVVAGMPGLGTVTDTDGNWSLTLPSGSTIQVTSIGYKTFEQTIGAAGTYNITLSEDAESLDEAVVIGYGSARKGDLTGSIASVKGQAVEERSTQQLTNALQGQIAGLQVTRSTGAPGETGTIRIHGVTTMSDNDPLVIIDGVPGSLDDVTASDVETLSVLKDAAAAAIYGSRAAAGVILVTTKRAKENQFSLDYSAQFAIDKPTGRPTNGNVIDWMNLQNEMSWNDGAASPTAIYSQEIIDNWMANNAKDPVHYPNTDWIDLTLKKTASHQQHTVVLTGGTAKLRTKMSLNYLTSDGYYENKGYDRVTTRINNDWTINNWMKASVDVNFSQGVFVRPASDDVYFRAYEASPYYTAYWDDGRMADCKDGYNPLAYLTGGTNKTGYYRLQAKAQLDITPFKGFTITGVFSPNYSFIKGKNFKKAVHLNYEDGRTITCEWFNTTNLTESRNDHQAYTSQLYANYNTNFGGSDHSLTAMAGYEGYSYKWENESATRNNYTLTNYPYLNLGPEDFQYNSGSAGHNAYRSFFGRIIYSFKNRYLLQANVRADASSRFAKQYRWGVFPSVSAGWVISEEPWFNNKGFINYLKLRGSYGQLGNERIGSEFPYQALMEFGNSYMYDKGSKSVSAIQIAHQTYYAFENITWETTTSTGLGIDAALLDSRLSLTLDGYYKKTSNMLLTLGFPSYAGFSAPQQNAGDMNTWGWDLTLGWADRAGDFWYNVSANISDYRSKMGYLGDRRNISGNYITEEGSYFQEWYVYQNAGIIQSEADMLNPDGSKIAVLNKSDKPGCIKYVDQNGDGVINADDKVKLGNSLPEYLYGANFSMGWKGWDFNMSFQGIGHQLVMFDTARIQPGRRQWGAVPSILLGNYWSKHNTEEENLKAKYPYVTWNNTGNIYAGSDFWLFNGAYFRVKNITLGYTIPANILSKTFVKNLRLYASVTDLPAISNYPKQWDPEVATNSTYISTSYIFGLNVKF